MSLDDLEVSLRPEASSDRESIRHVHAIALGAAEARLVDLLRDADEDCGPSVVAEHEGTVVGHVLFEGADLVGSDATRRVVALAPVSVLPEFQRRGIGSALIRAGVVDIRLPISVLGHETYYPRFGFVPAVTHGIEWPWQDEEPTPPVFMVWFPPEGDWSAYRRRLRALSAFDAI